MGVGEPQTLKARRSGLLAAIGHAPQGNFSVRGLPIRRRPVGQRLQVPARVLGLLGQNQQPLLILHADQSDQHVCCAEVRCRTLTELAGKAGAVGLHLARLRQLQRLDGQPIRAIAMRARGPAPSS